MALVVFSVLALGSGTIERAIESDNGSATRAQRQAKKEVEKFKRLVREDNEKFTGSNDFESTIENFALFQPQLITEIGEITNARLSEPGRPYYFKFRAIYKGHDARAEKIILQGRISSFKRKR